MAGLELDPELVARATDIFVNGTRTYEYTSDSDTGEHKRAPNAPFDAAYDAMEEGGYNVNSIAPDILQIKWGITKAVMRKVKNWRKIVQTRQDEADKLNEGIEIRLDKAA